MFTFRRALLGAAIFITIIYLMARKRESSTEPPFKQTHSASTAHVTDNIQEVVNVDRDYSQKLLQDMSRASLQEKLAYQYSYNLGIKFPAYIWQTWKYTPSSGEFKESYRPAEASWTEQHPTFIHEVITDQVAVHLLRHLYASIPEVLDAYTSLPSAILKADFFRYLILFARGGIYSDIDTYVLKSTVEWLPDSVSREAIGLVIGIESDPDREDWSLLYPRRILFCQWTIQAKPGHPVLREIIANITKTTLQKAKDGQLSNFNMENIHEFTGSTLWTDTIFSYFNDERYFDMNTSTGNITWRDFTGIKVPKRVGDIAILPITSFSPGINKMGAGDFDDPLAFVRHEFAGTWKSDTEKQVAPHDLQ